MEFQCFPWLFIWILYSINSNFWLQVSTSGPWWWDSISSVPYYGAMVTSWDFLGGLHPIKPGQKLKTWRKPGGATAGPGWVKAPTMCNVTLQNIRFDSVWYQLTGVSKNASQCLVNPRFKKQNESPHFNVLKKFLLINRLVVNPPFWHPFLQDLKHHKILQKEIRET